MQTLRGVAVLLMVAGHVIGSTRDYGLTVGDDSWWRFSYVALEDLRMPLFAALSGLVYAYRPVRSTADTRRLLRGKVRRLLVPYLTVGAAFVLVQMLVPGTNHRPELSGLPGDFLFGVAHLWFLQAIFLVFVVVGWLDALGVLSSWRGWLAVTVGSSVLAVWARVPDDLAVFSVNGTLRLLPFFLLGYGLHVHGGKLVHRHLLVPAAASFVPVYGVRLWAISTGAQMPVPAARALSLSVAVLVVLTVVGLRGRLHWAPLAWIGGFSFGIYLLHVFGAAGARILGGALGLEGDAVLFVLGMVAGVGLPVTVELLVGSYAVLSWGVLGQKPRGRRGARHGAVVPEPNVVVDAAAVAPPQVVDRRPPRTDVTPAPVGTAPPRVP